MPIYSLKQILTAIADKEGKRRLIFNAEPLGGVRSSTIYWIIISLPFIEYAILFNRYSFEKLGIATAIIGYIIFLSTSMMAVFGMVWLNNRNVIKKINNSWAFYYPNVDINLVIASGYTPYRDFFNHYADGIKKQKSDDELQSFITKSIALMEEENRDLLIAMETSRK